MTTKFDAIGLVTTDLAASLDFYRALGLSVPAADGPHVEAALPGGTRLMWDTVDTIRSFDPEWTPPAGGARVALCFACAEVAEVDRTYQKLTAEGYHGQVAPFDAPWGYRYATVHDPDGNGVDLFAPL